MALIDHTACMLVYLPWSLQHHWINAQKLAEATISADEDALETFNISQSLQMLTAKTNKGGSEGEDFPPLACLI